jgi:hypothetical protein
MAVKERQLAQAARAGTGVLSAAELGARMERMDAVMDDRKGFDSVSTTGQGR